MNQGTEEKMVARRFAALNSAAKLARAVALGGDGGVPRRA